MAVGQQPTRSQLDQELTSIALQMRDTFTAVANWADQVLKAGATGLQGYDPGTAPAAYTSAEATDMINKAGLLATFPQIWHGIQGQGPVGGTAASYDFYDALKSVMAGR